MNTDNDGLLNRHNGDEAVEKHAHRGTLVEVADTDLAFHSVPLTDATPTGRQVLAACNLSPHTAYVILQWLPGGDVEEIRPEEQIDMSGEAAPKLIISKADRTYRFVLADHSMVWPEAKIAEKTLRTLGNVGPTQQIYLSREDGPDHLVDLNTVVDLDRAGTETFYIKAGQWKLNVQGVTITSNTPEISVRDAMTRAGFDANAAWIIVLKTAAERKQVAIDGIIDLRLPGIEKLRLTPREINNGEAPVRMRREFALLPSDEVGLAVRELEWSTIIENGRRWLLLHDMSLPAGFLSTESTIAMEIPSSYPMAEIDMFYCYPAIVRQDRREIPQTEVTQMIIGCPFQRWSRHRGSIAPWLPGKDSVLTHLALVDASLTREIEQ